MTGPAAALTPEQQAMAAVLQAFSSGMAAQSAQPTQSADHKRKRSASTPAQPLLSPVFNEPLLSFFARLKPLAEQQKVALLSRADALKEDGIYMQKRPVVGGDSPGSLLALAGTVLHHVLLYIKDGDSVHRLDYGPHDGSDITSDLTASVPCHSCLARNATIPPQDTLPLLYLGPCPTPLDSPTVTEAIKFAESRKYNAVRNNCIHFADFMVRILTGGRLLSAPLLYDSLAGGLPAQEPVMLAMMPLVTGVTWFQAVDGSKMHEQFSTQFKAGAGGLPSGSTLAHSSSAESLPLKRQETAEKDDTGSSQDSGALEGRLEASNNAAGLQEQEAEVQETVKVAA